MPVISTDRPQKPIKTELDVFRASLGGKGAGGDTGDGGTGPPITQLDAFTNGSSVKLRPGVGVGTEGTGCTLFKQIFHDPGTHVVKHS